MHHSMLPLIISCTRSWNFAWHLLWLSTTESKNIIKVSAIRRTIHTLCWEDDCFPKGKFKSFNGWFHSVYLVFPKSLFLLPICLPCVICGSYVTKINAMLWHSAQQTFASLGSFTFARIACLQLWIKRQTRLLYLGDVKITRRLRPCSHVYLLLKTRTSFILRFGLPSTRIQWKRSPKTHLVKDAFQRGDFWKPSAYRLRVDGRKRMFSIRWCHTSYTAYPVRHSILVPSC